MNPCLDLIRFADGELDPERAAAFRDHLRTCEACQTGLVEALQLSAHLSTLTPSPVTEPAPPAVTDNTEMVTRAPIDAPRSSRGFPWKRAIQWGTCSLACLGLAAAISVRFYDPEVPSNVFARTTTRPYPMRLAHPGAADHRPLRDVPRGVDSAPADRIPYDALSALEARGDKHSLALAQAWNGQKLDDVVRQLSELPPSPAIRNDLTAFKSMNTNADNFQPLLAELEAVMRDEDVHAVRAARWNYALLLSRLELPLSAARAFREIANDNEPGWAMEASKRAADEAQRARDFYEKWKRAFDAGRALVENGAPVPSELVRDRPGVLRAYFYQAVGVAQTRESVQALAPMALELDRLGDPQQPVLSDYVRRVARVDFRRRAPLARAYKDLLAGKQLGEQAEKELTSENAPEDVADIVMAAMVEREIVASHREWFGRMVQRFGDPWFDIVLARAVADTELANKNWQAAEALLSNAKKRCTAALSYQCITLDRRLGKLYIDQHRVQESLTMLKGALRSARSAGEWERYRGVLWYLANAERFHSATAMVRAYARERVLMGQDDRPDADHTTNDCADRSYTHLLLAGAAILDLDGKQARAELSESLRCGEPMLDHAIPFPDIARLDQQPGDFAQLQSLMSKIRASGKLSPAERALADQTEGRLVIEHDRAAGIALLRSAIAAAEKLPDDVHADKARAGAYSVLAFDAARSTDYTGVFRLIAEDLRMSPPDTCAVGMVAEDERAAVVVRGADGNDRGEYRATRAGPDSDPDGAALPTLSVDLNRTLASCRRIEVMARAALQGQPRVLPAEFPWSYVTGGPGRVPPPSNLAGGRRTLIVANVRSPDYLRLPSLVAQPVDTGSAIVLSGTDATPARVMAAMEEASEIQFHTHALMDVGVSDASHLVLSPESPGGRYALTAEAIRRMQLRGRPLVVLAACQSARGARYQHAPWSLPDAFLAAGARAVFATATEIPDAESAHFFADVLARIRSGIDPAVALRDERARVLRTQPASWVADVILFE